MSLSLFRERNTGAGLAGVASSRDQFVGCLRVKMIPIDVWRARIGLFNNFRNRRSSDERVEALIELRARLSRRAKGKKACEEDEAQEVEETEQGGGDIEQGGGEGGAGVEWNSSDRVKMLLRMLVAILFILLIVSGSVELNPGPKLSEYNIACVLN